MNYGKSLQRLNPLIYGRSSAPLRGCRILDCIKIASLRDAINACGGVLPNADHENINMAQVLKDGQQLRVPEKTNGSSQAGTAGNSGTGKAGLVNINTADEKALDALPGIGPAMAKRIIEYRETEGQFQTIEDLKKVKGIGDAKFNKMKDKLCV